jgi:hypothetical protein
MGKYIVVPLLALLLAACGSNAQRVEQPIGEVFASLADMRSDANAMPLATRLPGTRSQVEQTESEVVWRFTQHGEEYGRFIAALAADGPAATNVTTRYEPVPNRGDLAFLHNVAQAAGEASVAAALAQQPVDMAALEQQISQIAVTNPVAAQIAVIETVSDEMDARAPPDPCDSDDRATRERCETFERNRGRGSSETWR